MGLFKRRSRTPVERLMSAAGLPTAGGEVPVRDVVMDVVRRNRRVAAVLGVVEELLTGEGPAAEVAYDFIEDLQNAASHGIDGLLTTEELLPLRGPRTVEAWETVDRFWAAVVAWCDETGVELDPAETLRAVENPALRSIMWPTCRSLPDGRRVRLSDVIRYEKAVGTPMAGIGHRPD
ncbi:hypothetical protein [Micromonospora siamensis]|uniref:Uncharacterized protein n=1 Tax=Micromonospora siamensis TaxID=299152 RepID=A0A1C5J1C0_9ACTN|nr:hypothetical protein [Micromonospora siamensis]SCG63949.1 hypothetical protein GA0074704_3989 [Micromonospora siamensis]